MPDVTKGDSEVVNFDTSDIPWWAWVKRFHLPEVRVAAALCDAQRVAAMRCGLVVWQGTTALHRILTALYDGG